MATWVPHRHTFDGDFFTEVRRGNVEGHTIVHKFGRNDAVPNGSFAFVNQLGMTAWPLSAATTVRVKAGGDAADTVAGAGARTLVVLGIDDTLAEAQEEIDLAGISASAATTTKFWRVYRSWVSGVGTYGAANTGAIVVENGAGGTDLIQVTADEGQSQFCAWTVPAGKTAYLLSVDVSVDAAKAADIRVFWRADMTNTTAPMSPKRVALYFDGVLGYLHHEPKGPSMVFAAGTDIWCEAQGGGAGTEVSAELELLVIDD